MCKNRKYNKEEKILNELLKVNFENERPTVLGRELHVFLEVKTPYKDWFPRMSEYGFTENLDFSTILSESTGGRPSTDHQLTIDMAKEIAMLQRNEKGKVARQYFIQVEKEFNSPERIMARALKIADQTINCLQLETKQQKQIIGELKPKADYTDTILKNKGLVTITQIAKDYGMTGNAMNELLHDLGIQFKQSEQWLLYKVHHDKGYTHSQTINIIKTDGRPDVKMNTKWTQKGRLFIYNLLKENYILPIIETDQNKEAI